jgi:hypothetical protein
MSRWYEGAEEAAFKPVPGGYVAQLPSPKLFGRPRRYLVNEAQKAEIAAALRRQRRLMLVLMPIPLAIALIAGLVYVMSHAQSGPALSPLMIGTGTALLFVFVVFVVFLVNIHVMRQLRPLLAMLPRTDQRIRFGEQVERVAGAVSGKVLAVGLISGAVVTVVNLLMIADAVWEGRADIMLQRGNAIAALGGAVLTAYFAWLVILRCRLPRGQRS